MHLGDLQRALRALRLATLRTGAGRRDEVESRLATLEYACRVARSRARRAIRPTPLIVPGDLVASVQRATQLAEAEQLTEQDACGVLEQVDAVLRQRGFLPLTKS